MSKIGSDFGPRLVVAVGLIAGAALFLWLGGVFFWAALAAVGLLMFNEWGALSGADARAARIAQYALTVPLAALCPWAEAPIALAVGLLGGAAIFVMSVTRQNKLALGVLYVGLPVIALVYLRSQEPWTYGLLLTFWAMALVWAADSAAYFAGRLIGGAKLAPSISPGKTWSGVAGGVAGAVGFAFLLVWLCDLPVALAWATPLLAALSVVGDLYESHLKRQAGVKDSGNLLPGHGGLLDRLDGLVFVAPAAALIVMAITA